MAEQQPKGPQGKSQKGPTDPKSAPVPQPSQGQMLRKDENGLYGVPSQGQITKFNQPSQGQIFKEGANKQKPKE